MKPSNPEKQQRSQIQNDSMYARQIALPEIGKHGQSKLSTARVLVVGAGGLGCPVMQYLAAAGVGTIGIIDHDLIELSNLHRQILYSPHDIGHNKAETAQKKLQELHPDTHIVSYPFRLTKECALDIFQQYDIIADGTDNLHTRYLINDTCLQANIPFVYASVYRFEGQISVFNYCNTKGELGPNYRDLFPNQYDKENEINCNGSGTLGTITGVVGAIQANEIIKIILGIGEILSGKILHYDGLNHEYKTLQLPMLNKHRNQIPQSITNPTPINSHSTTASNELHTEDFIEWLKNGKKMQLIDIREAYEIDGNPINAAINIPMSEIQTRIHEIDPTIAVILLCQSGPRSAAAANLLQRKYKKNNIFHLAQGIDELMIRKDLPDNLLAYNANL